MTDEAPPILHAAFADYGADDEVVGVQETSARVSTNRVYRLSLASGRAVFAKVSSYGSYVHFRQDHARIREWIDLLQGSRYESFLARVLLKERLTAMQTTGIVLAMAAIVLIALPL